MIAIIKKAKSDYTSVLIIDWLNYYDASYPTFFYRRMNL